MLPVGTLWELNLEVVVSQIQGVDATAVTDLDHLADLGIVSWLSDTEVDGLASLARELLAVEGQLAATGGHSVHLGSLLVLDSELR